MRKDVGQTLEEGGINIAANCAATTEQKPYPPDRGRSQACGRQRQ